MAGCCISQHPSHRTGLHSSTALDLSGCLGSREPDGSSNPVLLAGLERSRPCVQQRVEGARGAGMQEAVLATQLLQRAVDCWLVLLQPRILYNVSNPSIITQQSTGHDNRTTAPCWGATTSPGSPWTHLTVLGQIYLFWKPDGSLMEASGESF